MVWLCPSDVVELRRREDFEELRRWEKRVITEEGERRLKEIRAQIEQLEDEMKRSLIRDYPYLFANGRLDYIITGDVAPEYGRPIYKRPSKLDQLRILNNPNYVEETRAGIKESLRRALVYQKHKYVQDFIAGRLPFSLQKHKYVEDFMAGGLLLDAHNKKKRMSKEEMLRSLMTEDEMGMIEDVQRDAELYRMCPFPCLGRI